MLTRVEGKAMSHDCQSHAWQQMAERNPEVHVAHPLKRRLKLLIVRNVDYQTLRQFKVRTNRLVKKLSRLRGSSPPAPMAGAGSPPEAATVPAVCPGPVIPPSRPEGRSPSEALQAGDLVRVRSMDEIRATLGTWGDLRGCAFMPEMEPYCGTTQRVFKRVERFLNERDYRVKEASGIVLLEGAICGGTAAFGRCDRSCFFFWREEWLERITEPAAENGGRSGAP